MPAKGAAFEHSFETSHAHVARRNEKLWAEFQALVEEPHHVFFAFFHGDIISFGNIDRRAEGQLLWLGLVAVFFCGQPPVHLIGPFALLHGHEYRHVGIFMPGSKIDGFHAGSARKPDGRRLLDRARPDVDIAVIVVFSLKCKRAGACPGLDNQVMRLVHTFPTDGGIDVIAKVFHAGAAHKARDNAPATDNVEHGNLFGDTQGVIVQRQSIAYNADFRALHPLR